MRLVHIMGLLQRDPERTRSRGDGWRGQLPPAATRTIRASDHERGTMSPAARKALENRCSEGGCADEDGAQRAGPDAGA